ncbi:hypothetical protein AQUCO_00400689v1 [Aquilegia coerulea]|uniref:TFIIS N-terminal domain-containing protein n=1 Tax=Aquilegia coerulea TaxID=218851 RepID=A0A2G5EWE4_AQUCA|nr:hypothetical protein AQUCO_00400689v1 [Aquilegia coerulea]
MSSEAGTFNWRKFFQSSNADIFEILEQAIMIAATDCPNDFKFRRDEIAEKLFTCQFTRCGGCDGLELSMPKEEQNKDVVKDNSKGHGDSVYLEEKENKGNCSTNGTSEMNANQVSCISYNEAEALTDVLEEEGQIIEDVFRIREILVNSIDQSSSSLLESLRRLQLMDLSMQILMTTNIGNAVSALRKHPTKEIAKLARDLVRSWKAMVTEVIAATEVAKTSKEKPLATNDSPDSVNPSVIDEEEFGLPSPPLDDGVFFAPETTSMELSKFFDGIDDDGNFDCGRINDDNGRMTKSMNRNLSRENNSIQRRKPQFPREQNLCPKDDKNHTMVKQETVTKQTKPSSDSGFGRPSKLGLVQKVNNEMKVEQKLDTSRMQRKPVAGQQDKSRAPGLLLDQKLENAKRKLHQGYQEAENAKKQRTIQVMELQDLPKQSLGSNSKNSHMRPGSHNRNWSNGRR